MDAAVVRPGTAPRRGHDPVPGQARRLGRVLPTPPAFRPRQLTRETRGPHDRGLPRPRAAPGRTTRWSSTSAPAPPAAGASWWRRTRSRRAGSSSSPRPTAADADQADPDPRRTSDEARARTRRRPPSRAAEADRRAVRPQPAHPDPGHRLVRGVRAGDPAARRAALRPAPARLLLHPRAPARGPADGHRADGARLRGGRAQDLRGDARARRWWSRPARARSAASTRPTRSCTARSTRSSRWTCGSPAARRARWPCCRGCGVAVGRLAEKTPGLTFIADEDGDGR